MTEADRILASMTRAEREMFHAMGGPAVPPNVGRHARDAASWHVPDPRWAQSRWSFEGHDGKRTRFVRPLGINGIRLHVEGLGEFPSARQAAIALGVDNSTIRERTKAPGGAVIAGRQVNRVNVEKPSCDTKDAA